MRRVLLADRLRWWFRYQRALNRAVDDAYRQGHKVSPWRYEVLRAEARTAADR